MIVPTRNAARSLRASIDIEASPARVWKVVSDVRRTGEWSPECARVVPIGGVRAGGWMIGVNRRGTVRWVTLSRIVRFEPEREIAWKVVTNGSRWSYRLESIENGTRLVETRETPRGVGVIASGFTRKNLGGQTAHDDELESGMATGLERIKSIVTA